MTLAVRVIDPAGVASAIARCTELAGSMRYPTFFCSADWLASAADLHHPSELKLFEVVEGDLVIGCFPLVRQKNRLGGDDLQMLGARYYPDPLGLICHSTRLQECIAAIRAHLSQSRDWDRLQLKWVLEDEARLWSDRYRTISVEPFLALPSTVEEILAEFKKKKRYNQKAAVAKFLDVSGHMVVAGDAASRLELFDHLLRLHEKRSTERNITSSMAGDQVLAMHRRLIGTSADVRLYALKLEAEVIAVLYGFEFGGRFFYYQIAHSPEHGELSPGSVLLHLVIDDCCRKGLVEFNFLQGGESYKWHWTKEARPLCQVQIYNSTLTGMVLRIVEDLKRAGRKLLKRESYGNSPQTL